MKLLTSMLGTFLVYYIYLGPMYADYQEKIFAEMSRRKLQSFHCNKVAAMKSLELSPRNLRKDFS